MVAGELCYAREVVVVVAIHESVCSLRVMYCRGHFENDWYWRLLSVIGLTTAAW